MPIATGYTPVPVQTLPLVVPPIDSVAAGNILMPTVTLGGQVLNSAFTDVFGIAWIITAIDGWDSPDVRLTQTPRANDHGLFVEPAYFGGRLLIVKGKIVAARGTSTQTLMAARDQLFSAWNLMVGTLSPFIVNETPPKMCWVQRMAGCKAAPSSPVSYDFEAHLLAPDPRKYDPFPTTTIIGLNSSAIVTNLGNIESRPLITVVGPCFSVALGNSTTGQLLTFAQPLLSTDVFKVDLDLKSATLNTNPVSYTVTSAPSQWWRLQPGANTITFSGSGGGATATLSSRSAWA
jgi:Phage tail protein